MGKRLRVLRGKIYIPRNSHKHTKARTNSEAFNVNSCRRFLTHVWREGGKTADIKVNLLPRFLTRFLTHIRREVGKLPKISRTVLVSWETIKCEYVRVRGGGGAEVKDENGPTSIDFDSKITNDKQIIL